MGGVKAKRVREMKSACARRTTNSRALTIARLKHYNFDSLEHESASASIGAYLASDGKTGIAGEAANSTHHCSR